MRSYAVLLAGVLMMLSAAAHGALGWPAMKAELDRVGASADLAGGLAAGWYFGSVAMVGFGLIVLFSGLRLRRGDPSGIASILVVATCYVSFGLGAYILLEFDAHFLLFIATGLLAGVPVLGRR